MKLMLDLLREQPEQTNAYGFAHTGDFIGVQAAAGGAFWMTGGGRFGFFDPSFNLAILFFLVCKHFIVQDFVKIRQVEDVDVSKNVLRQATSFPSAEFGMKNPHVVTNSVTFF